MKDIYAPCAVRLEIQNKWKYHPKPVEPVVSYSRPAYSRATTPASKIATAPTPSTIRPAAPLDVVLAGVAEAVPEPVVEDVMGVLELVVEDVTGVLDVEGADVIVGVALVTTEVLVVETTATEVGVEDVPLVVVDALAASEAEKTEQRAKPTLAAARRSDAMQAVSRHGVTAVWMADCAVPHWQASSLRAQPAMAMALVRQGIAQAGSAPKFWAEAKLAAAAAARITEDFIWIKGDRSERNDGTRVSIN